MFSAGCPVKARVELGKRRNVRNVPPVAIGGSSYLVLHVFGYGVGGEFEFPDERPLGAFVQSVDQLKQVAELVVFRVDAHVGFFDSWAGCSSPALVLQVYQRWCL